MVMTRNGRSKKLEAGSESSFTTLGLCFFFFTKSSTICTETEHPGKHCLECCNTHTHACMHAYAGLGEVGMSWKSPWIFLKKANTKWQDQTANPQGTFEKQKALTKFLNTSLLPGQEWEKWRANTKRKSHKSHTKKREREKDELERREWALRCGGKEVRHWKTVRRNSKRERRLWAQEKDDKSKTWETQQTDKGFLGPCQTQVQGRKKTTEH